jgi:hypothetical protein
MSSDHQTSWERATDPPVSLAEHGDPAALWTPAAQRYSTYVHGEAWDIALFSMAYGTLAIDVPFRDDDLTVLREQFQAGPRTFGWATNFGGPGLTIYRFERAGQRVQVATHPQETEWRLGADDGDLLAMLVDLLASTNQANEALARSLRLGRARQGVRRGVVDRHRRPDSAVVDPPWLRPLTYGKTLRWWAARLTARRWSGLAALRHEAWGVCC